MNLTNIKFPVFPIRSYYKLKEEQGIIYIATYKNIWILDNTNLPYDTLAKRRLRIKDPYPLTSSIYTISQLLKCKFNLFIDYNGKLFRHKKTKRTKIIYKEVINTKEKDGEIAIFVKDIPYPFFIGTILFSKYNEMYAGLLRINSSYILYEITNIKKRDTWKKI